MRLTLLGLCVAILTSMPVQAAEDVTPLDIEAAFCVGALSEQGSRPRGPSDAAIGAKESSRARTRQAAQSYLEKRGHRLNGSLYGKSRPLRIARRRGAAAAEECSGARRSANTCREQCGRNLNTAGGAPSADAIAACQQECAVRNPLPDQCQKAIACRTLRRRLPQ